MDPTSIGLGVAGLGSGILGGILGNQQYQMEQQQLQNAIKQFTDIGVPPTQALQIVFQKYQSAGQLTPQMQQAFQQAQSQMGQIQANDPTLQNAQLGALNQLEQIGSNGGMNLAMQANLQKQLNDSNAANAGRVGAIQQGFAQRGMGSPSGLEMVAQMQNAQNTTQNQQQASLDAAAQAQQNALNAIEQSGGLAGQMQQNQFSRQAQQAQAQDSINRFNTQMLQSANAANTAAQNQAQQMNLANAQNVMNANTAGQNSTNQYNAQQVQQNYNDQLARAAGASQQYGNMGNFQGQQGQRTSNMFGGVGQGIAQLGTAAQNQSNFNNWMNAAYPNTNNKNDNFSNDLYQSAGTMGN